MLFGGIRIPGHPDPDNVRRLDMLPVPMVRRMQRLGMAINVPYLHDLTSRLDSEMTDLRADIASVIPVDALDAFVEKTTVIDEDADWSPINVESGPQLAKLLFDILGIGKDRDLKTTASGDRPTTGKKQLEMLKADHPVIQKVLDYRERSKLKSTYTTRLPKLAVKHPRGRCCPICEMPHVDSTWRVHTQILLTRTDTGRAASKRPNLQQIPARSKLGRMVREAFIPSPGCVLVGCDFSQIELRMLAHCAVEANLAHIFLQGLDPHAHTAMRAFNKTLVEVTTGDGKLLYRAPCKNVNFGICVLGGQLVLTNHGEIPIENVTCQDLVWDGCQFVPHDGVRFNGYREVINYDGITATPDHYVWTSDGRGMELSEAMAKGARLLATGNQGRPITLPSDNIERNPLYERRQAPDGTCRMRGVRESLGDISRQHPGWQDTWMQVCGALSRSEISPLSGSLPCYSAEMHESIQSVLEELRSKGHSKLLQISRRIRELCAGALSTQGLQRTGDWQDRQRWTLRAWEHPTGITGPEHAEYQEECHGGLQRGDDYRNRPVLSPMCGLPWVRPVSWENQEISRNRSPLARDTATNSKKAPVYDILNAGPNRRFTVEGKLVSNCYGLTKDGLYDQMALTYATAGIPLPPHITVDWCDNFIKQWFSLYPGVLTYMDQQQYRARRYRIVWDIFGRVRMIPEARSALSWVKSAGLRQAGNMPIQSAAAAIMKIAMGAVEHELLQLDQAIHVWPLMTIHDELLLEADERYAEGVLEILCETMDRSMTDIGSGLSQCRVPIKSDGHTMPRWIKD